MPLIKNMKIKEVADKCFRHQRGFYKLPESYILAEVLYFNNTSMKKYALGPCQVIKATDGDTGSF